MGLWKELKDLFKASSKVSSRRPREELEEPTGSVFSKDSEVTDIRKSGDRNSPVQGYGNMEWYQIQGEIDQYLVKIDQTEVELDKIREKIGECDKAIKAIKEPISSRNNDIKTKQVELTSLRKLYDKVENEPNVKNKELREVKGIINEVEKEFGILEREVSSLMKTQADLTRNRDKLIEDEKIKIGQLDNQYVELEKQTKILAEKSDKQFGGGLGSTTISHSSLNSLKSAKTGEIREKAVVGYHTDQYTKGNASNTQSKIRS